MMLILVFWVGLFVCWIDGRLLVCVCVDFSLTLLIDVGCYDVCFGLRGYYYL